jgi:hypothetical protein
MKTRVAIHVEESVRESPETWLVKIEHLVRVLQCSPASIEGRSSYVSLSSLKALTLPPGPARLATCTDPAQSIYDIFAKIDGTSCENCVPHLMKVSGDDLDVHVLDVSSCVHNNSLDYLAVRSSKSIALPDQPLGRSTVEGRYLEASQFSVAEFNGTFLLAAWLHLMLITMLRSKESSSICVMRRKTILIARM